MMTTPAGAVPLTPCAGPEGPRDSPGEAPRTPQEAGDTIAAMRAAGLHVDPGLWVPSAECSQCYQGCSDDPKGA